MDVHELVDRCRWVKGAVTVTNVMDKLDVNDEVFILLSTAKNLAVIKGKLLFLQYVDDDDGEEDVQLTIEFAGNDKPLIQTMLLGVALNGRSPYVGDEEDGALNRLFWEVEDAVKYFESVQFVREIFTLERTSSVSGLISRLLTQQRKPKPE